MSMSIWHGRPPPKKLCLVRLSALGDVTHMLPIVNTIKAHFPLTEITWIIGQSEYPLVSHIPSIQFIPFNKKRGIRAYFDLYKRLKQQRFDVLLLMQLSLRANLIPLFVNAPIRIGFDNTRARNLHQFFVTDTIAKRSKQHVLDSFFGFTEALGIPEKHLVWDCCHTPKEIEKVRQWLPNNKKVLLIHPCSSHPLRNWSAENYAKIADYAASQHDLWIVLSGSDSPLEHHYAKSIQQLASTNIINCVGKTSLNELSALVQESDIVISPDSGPAHLATCTQTPVIGLYAASNPQRTGPYLSQQWCINQYPKAVKQFLKQDYQTVPWGTRIRDQAAMQLITVGAVKEKIDQHLNAILCG